MITLPIDPVKPSGGTAPYTFVYSSTDTTVTFSNATGTAALVGTEYQCQSNVTYQTQSSIDTAIIQCIVTDANGCTSTFSPVVVPNPCNLQNTISTNGDFVFVAATTGGSGTYSYEWIYDDNIFQENGNVDQFDNQISFDLINTPPASSLVTCVVTDTYGCSVKSSLSYSFCKPSWDRTPGVNLYCTTTPAFKGCSLTPASVYNGFSLSNIVNVCANQIIDWSTLEFSLPSSLCIVNNGDGTINVVSSKVVGVSYLITVSVKTTSGIKSQDLFLPINAPTCSVNTVIDAVNSSTQITAANSVGNVLNLDTSNKVSGDNIDWATLQITTSPTFGTAAINPNGDILYTISDLVTTPSVPDIIKWSINSTTGYTAYGTDTILRDAIAAPSTTTETICAKCQEATPAFDLTANDTGDINKSSVTIVLNDPDIIITQDSNFNFIFTSLPTASFSNLNSYKVANSQGVFSGNQNFIVSSACVGDDKTPTNDLTCTVSKSFDLLSLFTNMNAFNVSFAETTVTTPTYTTQGGTIVGANGTVDFTAIATDREYTFQVTGENIVACTPTYDDVGTVTVIHGITPHITFGTAVDNGNGTSTYPFTYSGISAPFSVTINGSAATFQSGIIATNGSGTFTLYNIPSVVNTVVLSSVNQCGVAVSDTDATLTP